MRTSRALAHVIAIVTVVGVAIQLATAAVTEPKNLIWGFGIVLLTLTALVAGWIIALRRPANPLGWLMLAIPLLLALQGYAALGALLVADRAPEAASWLDWYGGDNQWSWLPPLGLLFTQIPLRFPDGALPSPRWRGFSWATIAVITAVSAMTMTFGPEVGPHLANPTYVDWGAATDAVSLGSFSVLIAAVLGSLASMGVRYHRAGAVERAQLRWVFWAAAVVAGMLVVGAVLTAVAGGTERGTVGSAVAIVWILVTSITYSLIPLAILFAVLRRGLYSIDRIISRTAVYTVVTATIVAVYAGIVVLGSLLLPRLPSVGVAVATLAAAALFLPLLRVVRRIVDRRFNRSQYDAQRVVDAFGERIRTGADPHAAGVDLLGAVERTLEPAAVGLWTVER